MAKVVKLAQPGYDARTAGDENLIFSSNWPTLKIVKSGVYRATTPELDAGQIVVEHGLGYVPFFWYFSNNQLDSWGSNDMYIEERSEFMGPTFYQPFVNDKHIGWKINQASLPNSGVHQLYYYIFDLDIAQNYTAPTVNVGAVGQGNRSVKMKIASPDKPLQRLEDYSIHSDARSPLIHAVYVGVAEAGANVPGGIGFTYYHNLGYKPLVFAILNFENIDNDIVPRDSWQPQFLGSLGGSYVVVDEEKVAVAIPEVGHKYSIIVLKDPFSVDYEVDVLV